MRRTIQYAAQAVAALSLSLAATGSMADTVINDDLIVVGNTCVGQDCTNGMAFNGNELILRENNTRIAFGSDGQFRLAASSSVNGGANEFRIDGI